jgi:hypothetical protein
MTVCLRELQAWLYQYLVLANLADMLKDNEEDNAKELIKKAFLQSKMERTANA